MGRPTARGLTQISTSEIHGTPAAPVCLGASALKIQGLPRLSKARP